MGLWPRWWGSWAVVARAHVVVIVVAVHQGSGVEVDGLELWPLGAAAVPVEADAIVALVTTFETSTYCQWDSIHVREPCQIIL